MCVYTIEHFVLHAQYKQELMSGEAAKERVTTNLDYLRISVLVRRNARHAVYHLLEAT